MNDSLNITTGIGAPQKIPGSVIVLLFLSLIIGTFLRASLIVIYPLVVFFLCLYYRFKISSSFLLLFIFTIISLFLSFFTEAFLRYKLLSLFYMLPFLFLLFAHPPVEKGIQGNHLSIFIGSLTVIALINDLIGLIQVFRNPGSDDSLIGIYSQYSISINGLMLLNSFLFFYYFFQFFYKKKSCLHSIVPVFSCLFGSGFLWSGPYCVPGRIHS